MRFPLFVQTHSELSRNRSPEMPLPPLEFGAQNLNEVSLTVVDTPANAMSLQSPTCVTLSNRSVPPALRKLINLLLKLIVVSLKDIFMFGCSFVVARFAAPNDGAYIPKTSVELKKSTTVPGPPTLTQFEYLIVEFVTANTYPATSLPAVLEFTCWVVISESIIVMVPPCCPGKCM